MESRLLTTLFASVLVCTPEGSVTHRYGAPVAVENVLSDEALRPLRSLASEALAGKVGEAFLPFGSLAWARVQVVPHDPGFAVAVEEVLHPLARDRHASLTTSEYEFVVRNLRQGLWRLDASGVVETANDELAGWLETTIESLVGSPASRWLLESPRENQDRFEANFVTASGIRRRALVTRSEFRTPQGRVGGWFDIIADITAEHDLRTRLTDEVRRMSHLARTDPLTGLANRMAFEESSRRLGESSDPYALILADLDGFKTINDTRGHQAGDQALVNVARVLKACVREGDLVARLGGDEFAVLLPGAVAPTVEQVVARLQRRIDAETTTSVSIGWACSEGGTDDLSARADRAMYAEKRRRRERRPV